MAVLFRSLDPSSYILQIQIWLNLQTDYKLRLKPEKLTMTRVG